MHIDYSLLNKLKDDPRIKFLLENIDFCENVCNLLMPQIESNEYTFKKLEHVEPSNSFDIANNVLMQLSSNYPEIMKSYFQENKIVLEDNSNLSMGSGNAKFANGKLRIRYGLHYDINDVFLIVHEFMHSLNLKENNSDGKKLFSESFAVYSEFLTFDYLESNKICTEENNELLKLRQYYFYKRIESLKKYIEAIKVIKQNPNNVATDDVSIIDEGNFLSCVDYSLAGIISTILLNRKENGLFSNEDYVRLNEMIKDLNDREAINILFPNGLDINEFMHGNEQLNSLINKEKKIII